MNSSWRLERASNLFHKYNITMPLSTPILCHLFGCLFISLCHLSFSLIYYYTSYFLMWAWSSAFRIWSLSLVNSEYIDFVQFQCDDLSEFYVCLLNKNRLADATPIWRYALIVKMLFTLPFSVHFFFYTHIYIYLNYKST